MKKSVLLLVIPVVLVVVLIIVFVSVKANSPGKSEESILTVFSETYENIIDISGNIEAADEQYIYAAADGTIEKINFEEGDNVKKGDIVLVMDDIEQQYNIANLEYQIEQKKISGSPKEIELLNLQKKVLEKNLQDRHQAARFDGIIAELSVSEGDYVEAKDKLVTIINRAYLKATVEVAEVDSTRLALNQKVNFTFPAYDKPVVGYVSYFPSVGTITTRGATVIKTEVRIDNPPPEILTGFSFSGTITVTEPVKLILLDKRGIISQGGENFALRLSDSGDFEKIKVEVEPYGKDYVKILSGLKEGDKVQLSALKSGKRPDITQNRNKSENGRNGLEMAAPEPPPPR